MSTPEQDRRVARIKWCLSEAAVNIGAAMTTGTLNKLSEAIATVMDDQGIWLVYQDNFETELAELIKDVGE